MNAAMFFLPPDPVDAHVARSVHRTDGISLGERKLRLAILEDVVALLGRKGAASHARDEDYDEAVRWVASDDERHPFGFVRVCDALGFAPGPLRKRLLGAEFGTAPAPSKPTRLRDRGWAWAERQAEPWTAHDLAVAVGCDAKEARGLVADWRRNDRVRWVGETYGVGVARRVGQYLVRTEPRKARG